VAAPPAPWHAYPAAHGAQSTWPRGENVPRAHVVGVVALHAYPAGHTLHAPTTPPGDHVPTAQASGSLAGSAHACPAGQAWQPVLCAALCVPSTHGLHSASPPALKVPAGHGTGPPGPVQRLPAGQPPQVPAPARLKVPSVHCSHVPAPCPPRVPAGHATGAAAGEVHACPAGHGRHTTELLPSAYDPCSQGSGGAACDGQE